MYSSKSLKFVVTISCPFRFKFDDERVTKEDVKRALEEQYGGEEEVFLFFPSINICKCSIFYFIF